MKQYIQHSTRRVATAEGDGFTMLPDLHTANDLVVCSERRLRLPSLTHSWLVTGQLHEPP